MRRLMWGVSLLWLLVALPARAQEVQVPLDEAGRVETVDRRLAERVGLWTAEYPGFQEARLFQAADSSFVLEISMRRDGRLVRERLPRSAEEVAALRRRVQAAFEATANLDDSGAPNQEGRYLLLGQTTLAGLAFYGWAVPVAADVESGAAAAGLYLLTAATSFFAPLALTQDRPVTYGMANLSRYGVTRGIAHGLLLHRLLAGDEELECNELGCFHEGDGDDRAQLASAMAVSLAEGVGGYLWARNERMSAGTANAIAGGGDLGLFWGAGAAVLAGADDLGERPAAAILLPVTAGTVLGAHRLAKRRDYTWGDADLLYTAGAVGALGGFAAGDLLGDADHKKQMWGAAMLGSATGVYLADRLVRNTDFSVGQAMLNRLGAIAGGLAGASLGVMTEEETVALTGAALGAAAGYALTFAMLAPEAPAGRGERGPLSAWEVRVRPEGLLAAGRGSAAAPILSVRYRF